jgi:tetratricopeptide (TPR) repeat protein
MRLRQFIPASVLRVAMLGPALASILVALASRDATAQRRKDAPSEFTRQGLLIVNFAPRAGATLKLGRSAGNAVRARVGKLVNRREVDVIDGNEIEYRMDRAGFDPDGLFTLEDLHAIGHYLRADEYLWASVSSDPSGVRLSGELVLMRDERLRQPILDAVAPKLDSAARLFAKSVAAARTQLIPQRRCENALHDGSAERAIAAAREGVSGFPRSTIARTCLVWALRQSGAPTAEVLSVAQEILTIDSMNVHAIEAAAIALDSLRRRDAAATMWLRLAATDTADLDFALRISYALFDGGNAKRAEPFIARVSDAHPEDLRLVQQTWRIAYENKSWRRAITAAEILLARDTLALGDSTFFLRLATAYHSVNDSYRAIGTVARGVAAFPKDARLYTLYTQYVKAEADAAVPRGLDLFPKNADLLALSGKELRAKGRIAESLDATKRAVALDSTMTQGQLMVAQLEIELGRPDSALVSLHRALATGEDSSVVAQFALAKGNTLYRAANATKASGDFALALRFLAFADTVRGSTQSKFLVGAAALGIAQAALTEATKLKDKAESCRLAKLGADMIPVARVGLQAGQEAFGDAAKQSLDYLGQLDPYAGQELTTFCPRTP